MREPDLGVDEAVLPRRWWIAAQVTKSPRAFALEKSRRRLNPSRSVLSFQAPIASTVYDFLSLLLNPPSSPSCPTPLPPIHLVVQLTPLVEGRRAKCHPYFPDREGETATVSPPSAGKGAAPSLWVRLEKKEEREGARESVLRVGREGDHEGRRVVHLEYLGWRDHGTQSFATTLFPRECGKRKTSHHR